MSTQPPGGPPPDPPPYPNPYPSQPGGYPPQPDPYPTQPGGYPTQPNPYPAQPGDYAGQPPGPPGPPEPPFGGPPPPPGSQPWKWILPVVAIAVVVLLLAVVAVVVIATSGDDGGSTDVAATSLPPGEIFLENTADEGPDPFSASVAAATPPSTVPSNVPITLLPGITAPAFLTGGTSPPAGTPISVKPLSGGTPGLYGGTGDQRACNKEQMIDFLTRNAAKGAAWANAAGIGVGEVVEVHRLAHAAPSPQRHPGDEQRVQERPTDASSVGTARRDRRARRQPRGTPGSMRLRQSAVLPEPVRVRPGTTVLPGRDGTPATSPSSTRARRPSTSSR